MQEDTSVSFHWRTHISFIGQDFDKRTIILFGKPFGPMADTEIEE